jgi:protein-disulfide isomerase
MSKFVDAATTAVLAGSALVLAALAVRREFLNSPAGNPTSVRALAPAYVSDWEDFSRVGTWIGDSTAPVRIVEFADFECPFCRRFYESFRAVRDSVGDAVALLLVQFPLEGHRFAKPAALAAECAERFGRWEAFHDVIFSAQDSLGLKSWVSYARDAGIADTVAFAACVSERTSSSRIDSSLAAGRQLRVAGTPTVLINGWRYPHAPYDSLLEAVTQQLVARP